MNIFNLFFGSSSRISGLVAQYRLKEFWNTLSKAEKKFIEAQFDETLNSANVVESSQSKLGFLTVILDNGIDKHIHENEVILSKLVEQCELVFANASVMCKHFYLMSLIRFHYRLRNVDDHLRESVQACQRQIDLAPKARKAFQKEFGDRLPSHLGFKQLAIIRMKEKNFEGAKELVQSASRQGWSGDWETRLERINKKLN